ncbi:MAG: DUF2231 domain-containing protein [Myxococcota bacterium]
MDTWHPVAVHLPIAFVLLWPVIDALGLTLKRFDLCALALGLLGVTVVLSLVATATGQFAYDAAAAQGVDLDLLDTHANYANLVPWLLLLIAAARGFGPQKYGALGHWGAILLGFAMAAFIVVVGGSGGELVYEHGVGVRASKEATGAP